MQSENKIFSDFSKFFNGVAGTMAGMGREASENAREHAREWIAGMDFVSREEFDAVKDMAAKARSEADTLKARIDKLEATMRDKPATRKPAAKSSGAAASKTKSG